MRHGRMVGFLTTLGVIVEMVTPTPATAAALTIPISKNPAPTYGTEHLPPPSAFSARVWTTAVKDNVAYVGGEFTSAGGEPRSNVAAFDATTAAVTPWRPDASGHVHTLAAAENTVYIGGRFVGIRGLNRPRIAAVDARTHARAQFSTFKVGAALETDGGLVVTMEIPFNTGTATSVK